MGFPRSCAKSGCTRMATDRSSFCDLHQPESREVRQPYRSAYKDPEYRRNRMARYQLAGGRCEACRSHLKGPLHQHGRSWECDHVVEVAVWEFRRLPGSPNQLSNLRVLCVPCHKTKTTNNRTRRDRQ